MKAKFPVIDVHNHIFGDAPAKNVVRVMDAAGVKTFVNLTGNARLPIDGKSYTIERTEFSTFVKSHINRYPGRFRAFTMSDFAKWGDFKLINDDNFAQCCVEHLCEDIKKGACGLKITKELGLRFKDKSGKLIKIDDRRLDPIWQEAAKLKIPVLIHTSDPVAFFLPMNKDNEHYSTLKKFPGKMDLMHQRERLIASNRKTTFICPHVANYPENIEYVSDFLDKNKNVYIDFSARIDELGRQPYTSRKFFIKYQDRILFGLDMPVSTEAYSSYFRFLETDDEYFDYPDYLGRFGHCRWKIYGLNLPDDVLKKIYYKNAERVLCL